MLNVIDRKGITQVQVLFLMIILTVGQAMSKLGVIVLRYDGEELFGFVLAVCVSRWRCGEVVNGYG